MPKLKVTSKKKDKPKKDLTAAERANAAAGKGAGAKKEDKKKDAKKGEIVPAGKETPVDILPPLTEEQKQQKAVENDTRFRELELQGRKTGVEMMFILREIQGYELWKYMKDKQGKHFGNFDRWLKDAAPLARSTGYALLKSADKLIPIIPRKELEQYPRYAVDLLTKIPKVKLENAIIREAAKTQSKKDLVKTINEHAPEAHVEDKKTIKVDASSAPIILDAFKAAQAIGQIAESDVLEYICADWLDSPCQIEQYAGMSNRQAWEAHKQSEPEAVAARVTEGEDPVDDQPNELTPNLDADEVEQPAI